MTSQEKRGLLVAAPSSGSGKTVFTLALLRALKNHGFEIASAKTGPDYIDPAFHALASGTPSVNLDPWAMTEYRCRALALQQSGSHMLIEGMMGLYDGAADGSGSAAELAKNLAIPVLLVVDAAKQSHSIAALVRGFRDHDASISLAGVVLNKVGSDRHVEMLRNALSEIGVEVMGAVFRDERLQLPERHLGLVQAGETDNIQMFIEQAALLISRQCDLERIGNCFSPIQKSNEKTFPLSPLGQHVAIARDEAFSFIYPHLVTDWQDQGASLSFFSPLADEAPDNDADAVYLPGGYPELYGQKLASARHFKAGMLKAQKAGSVIHAECGGYMVLGEGLIDAEGGFHEMLGFLKLETSFKKRKLHLGYRRLKAEGFVMGDRLNAHEFHYTSAMVEDGDPLFEAQDAQGNLLGKLGLRNGLVTGSYMHIIDRWYP